MAAIYWFNHTPRSEYNSILGHTWSLAVEEHFYIIWPLIFLLFSKIKARGLSISIALFFMIYSLQILQNHLYIETDLNQTFRLDRWTSSAAIYLLSGCFAASFLQTKYWEKIHNSQITSAVLSLLFVIGFGVDFAYPNSTISPLESTSNRFGN